MREMYFKSILIADTSEHTAKYHEFQKGLNVITSHENHMGKSSLIKSLYYSIGAEVHFDDRWNKKTKIFITEFLVDGIEYKIARFRRNFAVFNDGMLILLTNNVSHELAKELEKIFSFSVYLADKKDKKVVLAPPALSYMPYYIDQDKGWADLYGSFDSMDQFTKAERKKSLYYHLHIYTKDTIELMAKRDLRKSELEQLVKKEADLKITLDALGNEMDNVVLVENKSDLEKVLFMPKEKIANIVRQLGDLRNEIQELESVLQQNQKQLEIIHEYKDIKQRKDFSERIISYRCPHCGCSLDEDLYDIVRENYNSSNEEYMLQQIQYITDSLERRLDEKESIYVEISNKLQNVEKVYDDSKDAYEIYLKQKGLQDTYKKYSEALADNIIEQHEKKAEINKYNSQLRKFPNKKEIEDTYIQYVRENIIELGAWDASYEGNIKLLKPIRAQGSLVSKIILAQCIALFQTMETNRSNVIRFPFIIDSPRGNEASVASSVEILKMIDEISSLPQVILATVDYDKYQSEEHKKAKVTFLNRKNALLCEEDYYKYKDEIEGMFDLIRNL